MPKDLSEQIKKVEDFLGVKLLPELVKLYKKSNGEKEKSPKYRLMSLGEVLEAPFAESYLKVFELDSFLKKK